MNFKRKNDYNHIQLHVVVVLSAIAAAFSIASFFFGGTSEAQIIRAVSKIEALKVGGTENRVKLQELYTDASFQKKQGESIDWAIQSIKGSAVGNPTAQWNTPQAAASNTLTPEQIAGVLKNAYINGNEKSDIIIIEYSDFECPYCQKHFENGTIENLVKNNKIASTFKQFPLNFHPLAQKAAEGNICVGKNLKADKFFEYTNEVFKSKNPTIETITKIAVGLGMSESDFKSCLDSNESVWQVQAETTEGQTLFGVNGTPWNVILNKKTGKFVVVSGAQPIAAFEQAIAQVK